MNAPEVRMGGEGLPVPAADDIDPAEVKASQTFWHSVSAKRLREGETPAEVLLYGQVKMAYSEPLTELPLVRGVPCRQWLGVKNLTEKGYARPSDPRFPSRRQYGHRLMWTAFYWRDIPPGFVIHHICGNRWCGEPLHLWALTEHQHNTLHGEMQG